MGYVFDALKRSWNKDGKPAGSAEGELKAVSSGVEGQAPATPPPASAADKVADEAAGEEGEILTPGDLELEAEQSLAQAESKIESTKEAVRDAAQSAAEFASAALAATRPQVRRPGAGEAVAQPGAVSKKAAAQAVQPPPSSEAADDAAAPTTEAAAKSSTSTPAAPVAAENISAWHGVEHVPAPREVDDRVVLLTAPASAPAEEYRAIRTSLLARWQQKRHLIHTITSAVPREGKTLTTINLGLSFAELRNRSTLVIEADLRRPAISSLLNLPSTPGLVGILAEGCDPHDAVIRVGANKLYVLPAGRASNESAVQLLSSNELVELLQRVRGVFDHVIIDTPPVLELADAGILGALSDEVILVSRAHHTPRTITDQAMQSLSSYNAPVGAMIATNERPKRRSLIGAGLFAGTTGRGWGG